MGRPPKNEMNKNMNINEEKMSPPRLRAKKLRLAGCLKNMEKLKKNVYLHSKRLKK